MHYAQLRVVPASLCILCTAVWTFAGALHDCLHLHAESHADVSDRSSGTAQTRCCHAAVHHAHGQHSHRHHAPSNSKPSESSEPTGSEEESDPHSDHCPVCDLLAQLSAISSPSVEVKRAETQIAVDSPRRAMVSQTQHIELVTRGPPVPALG